MKHKVSELEGALLDAAVAKAEGVAVHTDRLPYVFLKDRMPTTGRGDEFPPSWSPSQDWAIAGPIIERERIALSLTSDGWAASVGEPVAHDGPSVDAHAFGPTPLIAAMRAYVASKFGEEVDLP